MSAIEQVGAKGSESLRSGDARVRRTRRLLHESMGELLRQKEYEDIGVKEILDRAAVARSTFYAHFGDKDELLLSALHEIMDMDRPSSGTCDRVLRFSLPMFQHVERHRGKVDMPVPPRGHRSVHDKLEAVMRDVVERELARMPRDAGALPADLVARHVASTFIAVFEWWLTCAPELPAREAHARFVRLVTPAPG
jgi:AcrR family transcriptional regulator